jgi:hypothetical protein
MPQATRENILREFFAEECEAIGDENLEPILLNAFRPVRTEYGENMPIHEFISMVVAAVGFIDASLSLYDRGNSKRSKGDHNVEDFVALARSELQIPAEVDDQRIQLILLRIANK